MKNLRNSILFSRANINMYVQNQDMYVQNQDMYVQNQIIYPCLR